jgi:CPA2 family monovalent cation:H+ antiporter-2/glutathione-regulated potassium-efflux system protein KefB
MLALYTVGAIAGLVLAGRFILRPLLRLVGNMGERELFVVVGLFTVLASAALMHSLHLSTALGAFVAGVMLADSPYRHEIEADVEPFRSILLGLFFLAVGMVLDLEAVRENPLFVLSMALVLVAVKVALIAGLARLFGMAWKAALGLGLLLSQGGEFGFVLFAQAQNALLIAPQASSLFSAIVTLSMATTPFLMLATRRVRQLPDRKLAARDGPKADGAQALVVGYGRFGQTVAQMLMAGGIPVTLIDRDVEMIDVAREFGANVYFGDGTRLDLLRQAGAADAQLIAFCIDGDQVEPGFVQAVHEAFPRAAIYVRGFDRRSVINLRNLPVNYVMREVMESAVAMGRLALDNLGLGEDEIARAEDLYRTGDRDRLRAQIEGNDVRIGREQILTEPQRRLEP